MGYVLSVGCVPVGCMSVGYVLLTRLLFIAFAIEHDKNKLSVCNRAWQEPDVCYDREFRSARVNG